MTLFTLRSLQKDFGIKTILRNASFSLEEGDKVGLIGTNGSGKSTLLKIIAGLEPYDAGERWVNGRAKVVYLPQQPELDPQRTILEQVFADSGDVQSLIVEYETLSQAIAQHPSDLLMAQLSALSQKMEQTGAWDLESQAKAVLTKLGITDVHRPIHQLSGGYRKRIALANALLAQPDVLLMDEPTNHLDADTVDWLQNYLQRFRGALLLITHDRYFLDRVTSRILELDQGELLLYHGNYSYYLEHKATAEAALVSSQKKHASVLRRELEWLKRGPKARSTKQKARIERAHALQAQEFKQSLGKVDISTVGRRIGKKVIELHGVSKSFGDRPIIRNFSYLFGPEDRVGIIGPNGVGKSTLLNLAIKSISPDGGTVDHGSTIHIGYFDQHSEPLTDHPDTRVIDYLKSISDRIETTDGTVITASQMLERFLFPPIQQYAPIAKLSGGEKRRLFLLEVLMQSPNVLILDEPTNDLDIPTLTVLEDYLEDFNGCVLIVSHDRYFLDRTVDSILAFQLDGTLRAHTGNYSLYLEAIDTPAPPPAPKEVGAVEAAPIPKSPSRKLSYKEKREYEQLETQIPQWEAEKAQLEATLYRNPPSAYGDLKALTDRLAELTTAIDDGTQRWLDLAERA
jgi:ATP-binding cassette subfamily F protein uup